MARDHFGDSVPMLRTNCAIFIKNSLVSFKSTPNSATLQIPPPPLHWFWNNLLNFPLTFVQRTHSIPFIPKNIPLEGPGVDPWGKPIKCASNNYNLGQNWWHKPPLPRTIRWFGIWSHAQSSLSSKLLAEDGNRLLQHCSGRGTDTFFPNKRHSFRVFRGKVPFFSMCQQVLSRL